MSQEFVTRRELDARLAAERENTRGWITTAVAESAASQRRELDQVLLRFTSVADRLSNQVVDADTAASKALAAVDAMPGIIEEQLRLFDQSAERRSDDLRKQIREQGKVLDRYQSYERFARSSIVAGLRGLVALVTGPRVIGLIKRVFNWMFIIAIAVLVCAAWFIVMN